MDQIIIGQETLQGKGELTHHQPQLLIPNSGKPCKSYSGQWDDYYSNQLEQKKMKDKTQKRAQDREMKDQNDTETEQSKAVKVTVGQKQQQVCQKMAAELSDCFKSQIVCGQPQKHNRGIVDSKIVAILKFSIQFIYTIYIQTL